jgi:hypothetical protein
MEEIAKMENPYQSPRCEPDNYDWSDLASKILGRLILCGAALVFGWFAYIGWHVTVEYWEEIGYLDPLGPIVGVVYFVMLHVLCLVFAFMLK